MARSFQIAPAPHQVAPVELPDDGAQVIETSGVEVLDGSEVEALDGLEVLEGPKSIRANDNDAAADGEAAPPRVVPFASTLRSFR